MKATITVDCTPEEARAFFGLPDLTPLHEAYLERMQQLMKDGLSSADMEKMMGQWMPAMSSGFEQWQKLMWSAATGNTPKS
jgi:Family of unknown function (DUF6489)